MGTKESAKAVLKRTFCVHVLGRAVGATGLILSPFVVIAGVVYAGFSGFPIEDEADDAFEFIEKSAFMLIFGGPR